MLTQLEGRHGTSPSKKGCHKKQTEIYKSKKGFRHGDRICTHRNTNNLSELLSTKSYVEII